MRIFRLLFISLLILGSFGPPRQIAASAGLTYEAERPGPVPIPSSELALQTAVAEPWFQASSDNHVLEGAIFDRSGSLIFCDVTARSIMRLTADKQLETIATLKALSPGGLAIHRDGRLFMAALDLDNNRGAILAVNFDGSGLQTIIPAEAGYLPNDLVFDLNDGFYFTDFKGTATTPAGGVYYASPDFSTIKPVLPNLALANGLALSPDGQVLWATEFGRNLLHRIELAGATTIAPIGSAVPYRFTGPAPDSMRVDVDGNVYVAVYGQGRILTFNKIGIPIGQILLPGRDRGHNLLSTSLAVHPESRELLAVTSDGKGVHGASIFRSQAFAKGLEPAK